MFRGPLHDKIKENAHPKWDKKRPLGWKRRKMRDLSLLSDLVPELIEQAAERYALLRQVALSQPVGRRLLAVQMNLTERVVRGHVESLEKTGLLKIRPIGICLTEKGEKMLAPLSEYFMASPSLAECEHRLAELLHMEKVILVRGDSCRSETVKNRMGQEAALMLSRLLKDGEIMAVSGGTTLAALAAALPHTEADITVVPARGGFGERIEYQANTIAAVLAEKTGGTYRMLHIPDGFSTQVIDILRRETPDLSQVEALIHRADILVIGVGESQLMAQRHQLPPSVRKTLSGQGACGEALGVYADADGHILYRMNNVGITLEELKNIPHVLIAAGGSDKGDAIMGMAKAGVRGTLITDEGAAGRIFNRLSESSQGRKNNEHKNRH